MRMHWMVVFAMIGAAMWPCGASAAEFAGKWVAEISGPTLLEPVYATQRSMRSLRLTSASR